MSVASVTISYGAFADARITYLAQLAGYADADHALGKMARLWGRCTFLGTDVPGITEIRAHLGPRGEEHLVECGLGEQLADGDVRVRGAIAEDGTNRLGWYKPGGGAPPAQHPRSPGNNPQAPKPAREQRRAAGASRASKAVRGPKGQFLPRTSAGDSAGPAGDQRATSGTVSLDQRNGFAGPATSSGIASAGGSDLDLDPDRERSPARAGVAGDSAGPAGPADGPAGLQRSSGPAAVRPSSWQRRMGWWQAMLDAHRRLRDRGIKPNTPDLDPAPAGVHERNLVSCEKQLRDAGHDEATIDRKMLHVVLVAEAEAEREGHLDWFIPSKIWEPERFSRAVDTTLEKARAGSRRGPPGSGQPNPPRVPDPKRPPSERL